METTYIDKHTTLVNDCRNGNRNAQFEIYKLYVNAMYNVALRIVSDEAEAEDVLQEAFLDAFSRIADFRQETTFGLWLKQIVINRAINYLRKRKVEFVPIDDLEITEEASADEEEVKLKVEAIKEAINELPDGYRVVLTLYLFEGYDHEEIAHVLKITENTSRSQYMRAKKKLNSLLEMKGVAR
ncbi:MAG: RNA polymerase sigma factor [Bacteroidia bacterium]